MATNHRIEAPGEGVAKTTEASARRRRVSLIAWVIAAGACVSTTAFSFPALLVGARLAPRVELQGGAVAVARDATHAVLTLVPTWQAARGGPLALVIPVPASVQKRQVHFGDDGLMAALESYTAPRIVETDDGTPCPTPEPPPVAGREAPVTSINPRRVKGLSGEAATLVGRYEQIKIFPPKQAHTLPSWLSRHGYRALTHVQAAALIRLAKRGYALVVATAVPRRQGTKKTTGARRLPPLQIAFETPHLTLPFSLSHSKDEDLRLYGLTRHGRLTVSGVRPSVAPAGDELPALVLEEPQRFYRALVDRLHATPTPTAYLEYAWEGTWCDPCAAPPLAAKTLHALGAYWVDEQASPPKDNLRLATAVPSARTQAIFITRYRLLSLAPLTAKTPDLALQESSDVNEFVERFSVRRPFAGKATCAGAADYRQALAKRSASEAEALARLTGWRVGDVRHEMGVPATTKSQDWIDGLWND